MNRSALNRGRPATSAIGVWLGTLAFGVSATVLVVLGLSVKVATAWGFPGFGVLMAVTFGTIGLLISVRVPGNRIGQLFAAIGLGSALQELIAAYVVYGGLVAPGTLPWVQQVAWFETWDWIPIAGAATTFLLLLFPDGRLPAARWRLVAWLSVGAIVVAGVIQSIQPGPIDSAEFIENPLGIAVAEPLIGLLGGIGFSGLVLAVLLSAVSMVVRFRRSRGAERQQLKWFASAAVLAGLVFAGLGAIDSANKGFQILTILGLLGLPVSAGIAILRYRLYEIDRIISRAIAYALVTGLLLAAYGVLIVVLQGPLATVTGSDTILVAVSTLVVATLFQPVLRRVRRAVDRRFDRSRYDAERTAAAFSERLRSEVDLGTVTTDLVNTATATVAPSTFGIWLRATVGGR